MRTGFSEWRLYIIEAPFLAAPILCFTHSCSSIGRPDIDAIIYVRQYMFKTYPFPPFDYSDESTRSFTSPSKLNFLFESFSQILPLYELFRTIIEPSNIPRVLLENHSLVQIQAIRTITIRPRGRNIAVS